MTVHSVTVQVHVAAPAERVWDLVCDVEILPSFSEELQAAAWIDDTPALGARFEGTNVHPLMGRWTTRCQVVQFVVPQVFAWSVGDPAKPAAIWRFEITPAGTSSILNYTAEIGPGRSALLEDGTTRVQSLMIISRYLRGAPRPPLRTPRTAMPSSEPPATAKTPTIEL